NDLTYSIMIPSTAPAFAESSMSIYETLHLAIRNVLIANGEDVKLATVAALSERRDEVDSAVRDRRYNKDSCFANPVRADVLSNGRKVAGAAQRRTRRGLLQQGSIQGIQLANKFADQFASELCSECYHKTLDEHLISRAHEIAGDKYGAQVWLRKR